MILHFTTVTTFPHSQHYGKSQFVFEIEIKG